MSPDRHVRLLASILARTRDGSLLQRLAVGAVDELGVDGLTVGLMSNGASDVVAEAGEGAGDVARAQFQLGEGPAIDAFGRQVDVHVPDVPASTSRWPAFAAAAAAAGVAAVFCLPASIGAVRLGTLTLVRRAAGALEEAQRRDARLVAEISTLLLIDAHADGEGDQEASLSVGWPAQQVVHQATGMVAVQIGGDLAVALAYLRGRSFASGSTLEQVARDVVEGRLRFDD